MKTSFYGLITYLLAILSLTVSCLIVFVVNTWDNVSINEILFHLNHIDGAGGGIISRGILFAAIPLAVFHIFFFFLNKTYKRKLCHLSLLILVVCIGVFIYNYNIKIGDFTSTFKPSSFIEDNYVNPDSVKIEFVEKRNLIHIYLESIETTYTDTNNGGMFSSNLIPNLTKLAQSNISFSGDAKKLNGAYSLYGSTWTTAAIFAQSTGVPLNEYRAARINDSFYPGIIGLGDILKDNGYDQVFILGSDASFASKDIFFKDHKDFTIIDYNYLVDNKKIPSNYYVHWGIEDDKLFDIAKNILINLAKGKKPFNVVILTVDTHPPNGFLNAACETKFTHGDYRNVILCSDKQVTDFINWIQSQEFYKNTTIVVTGDHLTKQIYKKNIIYSDTDIVRKAYTCYINAIHKDFIDKEYREYSVFDHFPTILSAIGANIQGNRLGLGTNLFSNEKTLLEQYGYEFVNTELSQQSVFLENLAKITDANFYNFKNLPKMPISKHCIGNIDYIKSNNERKLTNFGGWVIHSLNNQQEPIQTITLLKESAGDGNTIQFDGLKKLNRSDLLHFLPSNVHKDPGFLGQVPHDGSSYWIGYVYRNNFYQCTNLNIRESIKHENH